MMNIICDSKAVYIHAMNTYTYSVFLTASINLSLETNGEENQGCDRITQAHRKKTFY